MNYFNMKTRHGVETVDELNEDDFGSFRDFNAECRRMSSEYHLCGMNVYLSRRCTKEWQQATAGA